MQNLDIAHWVRFPTRSDPRIPFAAILTIYVVLGIGYLGFNRTPQQVLFTVGATVLLDFLLDRLLRRNEPPLFPLSAVISGLGLGILVNYSQGYWPILIPVLLTVASKYLFTFNGRHVYNPTLFGIAVCLLLFDDVISVAPPAQWGNSLAIVLFIVTGALTLFVFKINRNYLILSFLAFYFLQTAVRAWMFQNEIPPMSLFMGTLTSPEFYLFTFFMIPDPGTSPADRKKQMLMPAAVVLIDAYLQIQLHMLNSLFVALFLYGTGRLLWLHLTDFEGDIGRAGIAGLRKWLLRVAVLGLIMFGGWLIHSLAIAVNEDIDMAFRLEPVELEAAGIRSRRGEVLQQVDPRAAHMAKWVLGVGDAVAVADVDNDGRQDLFLTYTLKHPDDRVALYLNQGDYRFERFAIPALTALYADPAANGSPMGALFVDWDNDGDQDLIILAGYGKLRFFENRLIDERRLHFADVTHKVGFDDHATSVAANLLDLDRDGRLDLVVGNYFSPMLTGYSKPTPLNVFRLPSPEHPGDRRMLRFMQNSMTVADNGGGISVYRNDGYRFVRLDERSLGFTEKRFVLAIGAGDLNNDGWTDLYIANDFGPDHLMLSQHGTGFATMRNRWMSQLGFDHYKGMNASIADFFNKGHQDVYVSNIHHATITEGSMLWVNHGIRDAGDVNKIEDLAMQKNALNTNAWGWGAGVGDLDLDGRLDIVQANGWWDAIYDNEGPECRSDFWFFQDKLGATAENTISYVDMWPEARGTCAYDDDRNRVYLNRGDHFVDVAEKAGWRRSEGPSRAVALVDLTNTGKLDVIVTRQFAPVSLYKNTLATGRWVGLQLVGDGRRCNRDAVGSRVSIRYESEGNSMQQTREVQAANGFSAQGDRRLLFGLGEYSGEVTATINWCGQEEQRVTLSQNKYHRIVQPEATRPVTGPLPNKT